VAEVERAEAGAELAASAVAERAAEAGAERCGGGAVKWPGDRNVAGGKLLACASVIVGFR
jgi:hypothetical protein